MLLLRNECLQLFQLQITTLFFLSTPPRLISIRHVILLKTYHILVAPSLALARPRIVWICCHCCCCAVTAACTAVAQASQRACDTTVCVQNLNEHQPSPPLLPEQQQHRAHPNSSSGTTMPARPDPPQPESEDEGDDVEVCSDPPGQALPQLPLSVSPAVTAATAGHNPPRPRASATSAWRSTCWASLMIQRSPQTCCGTGFQAKWEVYR